MNYRRLSFLCLIFLLAVSDASLWAQTPTGQVNGTITDPQGAAMPGVEVALMNLDTQIEARRQTNEHGFFAFVNLRPGSYALRAEAAGFATAEVKALTVEVNQTVTRDLRLTIGAVTQRMEVRAESEMVQQSSAELGSVIRQQEVVNLPLNGRNFTQLLTLTPGAAPVTTSQGAAITAEDGGTLAIPGSAVANPSIQGQFNRSVIYYLDGVNNTDFRGSNYAILPNVDLIQEFKVQSHNDKAEYGGVTGGIVNIVSRSGTNEFHGSAYEFVRNNYFDARDTFVDAKRNAPLAYRQNEFGATLGGPVVKNKVFFSVGYEGWRYTKPPGTLELMPSAQELSGDFSQSVLKNAIYDPASTTLDPNNPGGYIRDRFPNNIIPSERLSPLTVNFIKKYFDTPNYFAVPGYNDIVLTPSTQQNDSYQAKADYQVRDSTSVRFRFSGMKVANQAPYTNKQVRISDMSAKNFGGSLVHVFTPRLIAELVGGYSNRPFAMGWNQVDLTSWSNDFGTMKTLGIAGLDTFGPVKFNLSGPYQGSVGAAFPNPRSNPAITFAPNVTWNRGNHMIKAGLQYVSDERVQIAPGYEYWFQNDTTNNPLQPGTTGNSLASAVLGLPYRYFGDAQAKAQIDFKFSVWSPYIQDEWKVTRTLTVTMGLRWEHLRNPRLDRGIATGPNLSTGNYEIGGGLMPPSCNQGVGNGIACIPGNGLQDVPFSQHIVLASNPVRGGNPTWDDWGPRMSVAWRALEKTVVRAGYAIVYDTISAQSQGYQNGLNKWPFVDGFNSFINALGQPLQNIQTLQTALPSGVPAANPWTYTGNFNSPDLQDPRSHQWNVELQQQVTNDLLVSAAYVGSHNERLNVSPVANVATTPGAGTAAQVNARRPYPWMPSYVYSMSMGNGNYNALQVKMDRRFAHGFQALVSYTWSKSIDTGSSGYFGSENGAGGTAAMQNLYDLNGSRSVSSYNVPHFLSISMNWQLPVGRGKRFLARGPVSWVLGNWETNLIAQFRSGQPFNLNVPGDVANIGVTNTSYNYARPNLVGDPHLNNPTAAKWFNTAAFQIPAYSFGNFGRNVLTSAHVSNVDFSLFRGFPLGKETRQLQLRAEAFNIFNIQNYGVPGVTIGQASAGVVSSIATLPRELQLGLKLLF